MDSNTTTALPFADLATNFEAMMHNIFLAIIVALAIGVGLVIFNTVTSTKATTRPVRTFR